MSQSTGFAAVLRDLSLATCVPVAEIVAGAVICAIADDYYWPILIGRADYGYLRVSFSGLMMGWSLEDSVQTHFGEAAFAACVGRLNPLGLVLTKITPTEGVVGVPDGPQRYCTYGEGGVQFPGSPFHGEDDTWANIEIARESLVR